MLSEMLVLECTAGRLTRVPFLREVSVRSNSLTKSKYVLPLFSPVLFSLLRRTKKKADLQKSSLKSSDSENINSVIDANETWFDAEKISAHIPATKLPAGLYVTGMRSGSLN
jgi:hypothetical protein